MDKFNIVNLPVLTSLKVTLLCDLRASLRLGWEASRRIPVEAAIAGGPWDPERVPRHPKRLRLVFVDSEMGTFSFMLISSCCLWFHLKLKCQSNKLHTQDVSGKDIKLKQQITQIVRGRQGKGVVKTILPCYTSAWDLQNLLQRKFPRGVFWEDVSLWQSCVIECSHVADANVFIFSRDSFRSIAECLIPTFFLQTPSFPIPVKYLPAMNWCTGDLQNMSPTAKTFYDTKRQSRAASIWNVFHKT